MRSWLVVVLLVGGMSRVILGQDVDLLSTIDVARDRVKGEWTWDEKRLVTPGAGQSLLNVPSEFPDDYRLLVVAERLAGSDSLNIGLVVGKNLVATAAHVVEGAFAQELELHFQGKGAKPINVTRIVYEDPSRDVCLLEAPVDRPILNVAHEHEFEALEPVTLLGNPSVGGELILRGAAVQGKLAAQIRVKSADFYQIDARVNPGSSGGPVVDASGSVIGLIAMKADESVVGRLRTELKALDSDLAARSSPNDRSGITFAVPGAVLGEALASVKQGSEDQLQQANDAHDARTAMCRLVVLHDLYLAQAQANVSAGVRKQYELLVRQGKIARATAAGSKSGKYVPIPSEQVGERMRQSLESDKFQSFQKSMSIGMRGQIERLTKDSKLDNHVKADLDAFFNHIQQVAAFAKSPADSYLKHNSKFLGFEEKAKELAGRLGESLRIED